MFRFSNAAKKLQTVLAVSIIAISPAAFAQQYPTQTIRIEVGFAAGGTPDIVARLFAQKLSVNLGQTVIVENRTGAAGNISADYVANANPDGYTLLLGADSQFVINPHLYPKMTDPFKSLTPVASLVANQFYLAVTPKLPVKNFEEFIAYAKTANPPIAFGTAGSGSQTHLGMELLAKRAGIKMQHVPYKGAGQYMIAAMSGEVQAIMASSILPQIEAGKLRGLAVTTPTPFKGTPTLPTIASFYPGYEVSIWLGLFTAAATPEPVVARLRKAIDEILKDPDTLARLDAIKLRANPTTPDGFKTLMHNDYDKFGKLVKELGVTADE